MQLSNIRGCPKTAALIGQQNYSSQQKNEMQQHSCSPKVSQHLAAEMAGAPPASNPVLLCRLFCSFKSNPSNPSIASHFSQLPIVTKYLHWCLVMARTRNVQNPTTERAEKRIPMKRKNLSPFNQVLQ